MKVDKVSVSFPADLGDEVRAAANRSGTSLSAWLGEAAQARLRSEALQAALEGYQAEHGAFTAEELARAEQELGLGADRSPNAA
jgi:metal-responsive CopG/Arc/MetJ family transcriptional regulator